MLALDSGQHRSIEEQRSCNLSTPLAKLEEDRTDGVKKSSSEGWSRAGWCSGRLHERAEPEMSPGEQADLFGQVTGCGTCIPAEVAGR